MTVAAAAEFALMIPESSIVAALHEQKHERKLANNPHSHRFFQAAHLDPAAMSFLGQAARGDLTLGTPPLRCRQGRPSPPRGQQGMSQKTGHLSAAHREERGKVNDFLVLFYFAWTVRTAVDD